ncbi:MAG: Fe-S metabolism protein SufE [Flavobacteriaceae bacterium]|nr:MAG: Fe-S metabolism protein SufE [Flavobacteriaceae bacterium]
MSIKEIQEEIINEFSMFEDWMERYEYIIELGKDLPIIEDHYKTADNLIKGCQSKVWLHADIIADNIVFTADSDAILTKGIVALLVRILSNQTPLEILGADLFFINEIGLTEHLSPTRANGLLAMVKQLKLYALAYQSKLG